MRRAIEAPSARTALTPLVDIAFLVLIFFMSLPLKRLDGKLQALLPRTHGIDTLPTHVEPQTPIRIHLRQRADTITYRIGEHSFDQPERLAPLIRLLGNTSTYEVRAGEGIPWKAVVATVDVLKALDCTKLQFYGTRSPSRKVRQLFPLPRPG